MSQLHTECLVTRTAPPCGEAADYARRWNAVMLTQEIQLCLCIAEFGAQVVDDGVVLQCGGCDVHCAQRKL